MKKNPSFYIYIVTLLMFSLSPKLQAQSGFFGSSSPTGYLILTPAIYDGALGYLAGADASCLSQVNSGASWRGKPATPFPATKVHALLCNSATCNELLGNTVYTFARIGYPAIGGAIFRSGVGGVPPAPGNNDNWSDADHFGVTENWWSGRQAGTDQTVWPAASAVNCSDWNNNFIVNGMTGNTNQTGYYRWGNVPSTCSNLKSLICIVHP